MTGNDPLAPAEAAACFVCGKEIWENRWFARIRHGLHRVIFCRPFCVEKFLQPPENALRGGWTTPEPWLHP